MAAARKIPGGFLPFIFLLLLQGCASTPQLDELRKQPPGGDSLVELEQVPFYAQQEFQCGPAALATVLNWTGVDTDPESLRPMVYLPDRRGSLQVEMLTATRRHGRVAYILRPRLQDLISELQAGSPVLVLQNLGLSFIPRWHYAVVVGFDLGKEHVILRSGTMKRHITPLDVFERTWARSGYWAMMALPPGKLPETAEEFSYLKSVAALEKSGQWQALKTSYQAALQRWPSSLLAHMGLGNTLYALRDLKGSAAVFRQATQYHPKSADAFNNLASVLLESGEDAAAEAAARQAVRLGGPSAEVYRRTLNEVINKGN